MGLQLWTGIEFVKHYRAHLVPTVIVCASNDGPLFASVAEDGGAKVFDVAKVGMLMIPLEDKQLESLISFAYFP